MNRRIFPTIKSSLKLANLENKTVLLLEVQLGLVKKWRNTLLQIMLILLFVVEI